MEWNMFLLHTAQPTNSQQPTYACDVRIKSFEIERDRTERNVHGNVYTYTVHTAYNIEGGQRTLRSIKTRVERIIRQAAVFVYVIFALKLISEIIHCDIFGVSKFG